MRPQTAKATRGRVIFLDIQPQSGAVQKLRLRKAGLHLVGLVAKVITLIILRFNSKATYLSKIKILMRLRHLNLLRGKELR